MAWMSEFVDAMFSVWIDDPLAERSLSGTSTDHDDGWWPSRRVAPPLPSGALASTAPSVRPDVDRLLAPMELYKVARAARIAGHESMTTGELGRAVTG
jgi:hypothetical protein